MAILVRKIVPRKKAEAALTVQYTAVACKCLIDKFTVTNTTGVACTFSAYLFTAGAGLVVGASSCIISARSIDPGETYLCPELVGQILEAGDAIVTNASIIDTLTLSATGREIN